MNSTLALVVAVPLLTAAVLSGLGSHLPQRVVSMVALAAAAATTALSFVLLLDAWPHSVIHWFAGWQPRNGHTVGIAFTADGLDASMACTIAVLSMVAIAFSVRYLDDVEHFFLVLMLLFLGGMLGFSLTGDLFNMFVFFELMSVSGFALCGYRMQQPAVLQGTLGFAVLNSIGAFFILMGITLVYALTGALNIAQIGEALSQHAPTGAVVTAFVLLLVGLLTKAGAVPFHFWLSDAYAVAPAPAGALFAGIMSDLALHGVGRIYWRGFSGALSAHSGAVRNAFIAIGVTSAVVGAVMCFLQADSKRQLAFLVVSQGGVFFAGIALLNGAGFAASTLYVTTDGALKAAVFLMFGLVVTRLGGSDELLLHGRGRRRGYAPLAIVLAVAALGLASVPGGGPWLSTAMLRHAADEAGFGWLPPVLAVSTAVVAGTLLRLVARVFLGWGPRTDAALTSRQPTEPSEGEPGSTGRQPRWLLIAPAMLVLASLATAVVPGLTGHALELGHKFVDLHGYVDDVLHAKVSPVPMTLPTLHVTALDWAYGAVTTAGAVAVAAFGLWWSLLPTLVRRALAGSGPVVATLKAAHSGALGDYALWVAGGASVLLIVGAAAFR